MTTTQKTYEQVIETKESYIDVYQPVAGWKPQLMVWMEMEEDGMAGFVCLNTSYFAYETREKAVVEAKQWAEDEDIAYVE